jgi:hypothetical protein
MSYLFANDMPLVTADQAHSYLRPELNAPENNIFPP